MIYFKIIPIYILNLMKLNIGKFFLLIITYILFHFAGSFENNNITSKVIFEQKLDKNYVYILDNENSIYTKFFDNKKEITNGNISYTSQNDLNYLFWILFGCSTIAFIITLVISFIDEDEWEFTTAFGRTIWFYTKSIMNNDRIDYLIFGRFITQSPIKSTLHRYEVVRNLFTISDITSLPKYNTVSIEREKKLKKLKIN